VKRLSIMPEGFKPKLAAILSVHAIGCSRLMQEEQAASVRGLAAHLLLCPRKPGPLGQSLIPSSGGRDNRLCRDSCCKRERNDGILECWNPGFSGMGSIFIRMARIFSFNQTVFRFRYPIFHYSTIPLFHAESKVNSTPLG